jgi:ketosteroid isomerase-like protein
MNKSVLSGMIFMMLTVMISSAAIADTNDDIERLEQRRIQAILDVDMPTLYSLYADDFFYNRAGGDSLTRAEYLPMYKSGKLKVNKSSSGGREVRIYGDTAVVTGIVHVDATISGENRNLHLRYLNVWIKRGDGWKLVARQATNLPMQN